MNSGNAILFILSDSICNRCNAKCQQAGSGQFHSAPGSKTFCPASKPVVMSGAPLAHAIRLNRHADTAAEVFHE
jgi:hypothetical protein